VSTSLDPWIGSELAGYRLEELLGRGGMGVVYRAWDPRLKRQVAVKLIAPELSGDPAFRERFLAEAELAAALEHPNVVPIHDAGEVEGQLYLVMRLVEGSDLKTLLAAEAPLAPGRAVAICAQLGGALDAAHARGLVHRDVKPSNVLLGQDEHVYLADFGLTRELAEQGALAGDGRSVGTPAYVAPEQIRGDDAAAAADQYALGCVLYECLTGAPPFAGERELAVLFAHLEDEPPRASGRNGEIPDAIDPVLQRALAKDPGERYPTCGELVADARRALGVLPAQRSSRRRGLALIGIGALVLAAGLAVALGLLLGGGSEASRTLATNSVARLDRESGEVAEVVAAGKTPTAVAAGSGSVWVVNEADGTVSQVDAGTGALRRTFRVNGSVPTDGYSNIAADGPVAWVVSTSGGRGGLTRLGDTEGPFPPQISLGIPDPVAVAVGEGSVWVAGKDVGENVILEIDPRKMAVVGRVAVSRGDKIMDIAVGEGSVWFTDWGVEETLWRLDPETMDVTGRLDTAGDDSVAVGDGAVWLGDIETGTLARVDPETMRLVTRLELFQPPLLATVDVTVGAGAAWLSFAQGRAVYRVDARSNELTATIELAVPGTEQEVFPPGPRGIAATEDGVWVAISSVGE
jgi:serine/threonine-protein kinase